MMFASAEDLTPDLEWMLQSGQVSREVLLEALLQEHFSPVYHLALMFLDDAPAARRAVERGLAAALLRVHEYREALGVLAWLYQIVLEEIWAERERRRAWIAKFLPGSPSKTPGTGEPLAWADEPAAFWQVFDTLADTEKVNLLLSQAQHWQPAQVGAVLEISETEANAGLRSVRLRVLGEIWKRQPARPASGDKAAFQEAELDMGRWLVQRWPAPVGWHDENSDLAEAVLDLAARRGARRRGLMLAREMALTAATILLVLGVIFGANWVWPEARPTLAASPLPPAARVITEVVYVTSAVQVIQIVTPTPSPTPEPPRQLEDILYLVQPGDTLPVVAFKLDTTIEELRRWNRIPSGTALQPGQRLVNPALVPPLPTLAATPVAPPSTSVPLATSYSAQALYQRLIPSPSDFASLWFDAFLIDYGPLSYLGPAHIQRVQTWLSQDQFLILMGDVRSVKTVWLQTGGKRYVARPGAGQPWFTDWDESTQGESMTDLITLYNAILSSRDLAASPFTTLKPGGREEIAARSALLVDVINQDGQREARFWVDDQSNLVLGKQFFGGEDFQTLMSEVLVTQVAFYVDLPQELFEVRLPWRGDFALDSGGRPIPATAWQTLPYVAEERTRREHTPAPQGFNPAGSRLAFQYPSSYQIDDNMTNVYLFAGDYLLSSTPFGNPWTAVCARAPDGLKLAFVSQPSRDAHAHAALYWLNLAEAPGTVQTVQTPAMVTQFSFAPDSQRLAVFGFNDLHGLGALYIVDTGTKAVEFLTPLADARSLVWSPQGDRLALIARFAQGSPDDYVLVISASGDILYSSPVDTESNAGSDWPMESWGVPFPVEMGRLDDCARPPGP